MHTCNLALGRLKKENHEFEASLSYTARACLKKRKEGRKEESEGRREGGRKEERKKEKNKERKKEKDRRKKERKIRKEKEGRKERRKRKKEERKKERKRKRKKERKKEKASCLQKVLAYFKCSLSDSCYLLVREKTVNKALWRQKLNNSATMV
jgi:hypothetical protein